jgi:tRNA A-37 threonylcarbamoyl transferase component Bud32
MGRLTATTERSAQPSILIANPMIHAMRLLSTDRLLPDDGISPQITTHAAHGFHWRTLPEGERLFNGLAANLEEWIRDGSARIIKDGLQRTIYRVARPNGTFYIKRCRVNGLRAWFREFVRGAKSALEFRNACRLRALGIAAIEPLAWAVRSRLLPSETLFVTRCAGPSIPLEEFLNQRIDPNDVELRHRIAIELGRLMAEMHDVGVAHPDPHPGNLLVTIDEESVPQFTLIDLHAIRFGEPLTWTESLRNLVLLNRWFQLRCTRTDRLRFWRSYVRHRTTLPTECEVALGLMARDVEHRTERSNARFWSHRLIRYQRNNRQYRVLKGEATRGHAVRDLSHEFVAHLLQDPDAPFRDAEATVLKSSRTSTVIELRIPTPSGQRVAIYKRFNLKSPLQRLKNSVRPTAAMRSWTLGHNLLDRGLPTARPLVVIERTKLGAPTVGYLLTERVPDAMGLTEAVAARPTAARQWADELGRLLRTMHDREVSHRDLKASNILMSQLSGPSQETAATLIDLVGVSLNGVVSERTRVRDLARLNASFLQNPAVTRSDKLRFLRAYLGWGLHGSEGWKAWWRWIADATRAKVAKNARTGRPLA